MQKAASSVEITDDDRPHTHLSISSEKAEFARATAAKCRDSPSATSAPATEVTSGCASFALGAADDLEGEIEVCL